MSLHAHNELSACWYTGDDTLFEALKSAGGKVYSNYAVGYNNVKVEEATKRGIAVGNTPGVLTETTAEMAITLTLVVWQYLILASAPRRAPIEKGPLNRSCNRFGAARRLPESEVFTKAGKYEGWLPDLFLGKRLWGGTVGIIGAGRIG
eukprot:SAG11_NODE_3510_length_2404_cov_6.097180_1_plen_148_part_10